MKYMYSEHFKWNWCNISTLLLPANKVRRLCFYTCVSVHRGESTWAGTPPDQVPPWDQVHPLGPGTPWDQVHAPGPGTPSGTRYTPPWTRYTPRWQCMLGDTGNKRAVRILLECILVLLFFQKSYN